MGSGAFYSVRGLLLKSLPVRAEVQAGSACQPGGPARNHAPPCGRRGVLWEAMRFIMRGDFYGKSRAGGALESRLSLPHSRLGGYNRIY